jgi:hypothetical protein
MRKPARPRGQADHARNVARVREEAAAADLVEQIIADTGADERVGAWFRALVGSPERLESEERVEKLRNTKK